MPQRNYGGRPDWGLGWGDRDWGGDPEGQWRAYDNRGSRNRDFDRERYQREFGRGPDRDYDDFYGREPDRAPSYGRDYQDDFERPYSARNRGAGVGDTFGYYGYRRYGDYGRIYPNTERNHVGRGPRGYRRSDERIRDDVNDLLTIDPEIDATDVEVQVENGIVTLRGVVEDRRIKRLAEDISENVMGVEDVNNQLKVKHGMFARLTGEHAEDREIKRTAQRDTAAPDNGEKGTRNTTARTARASTR